VVLTMRRITLRDGETTPPLNFTSDTCWLHPFYRVAATEATRVSASFQAVRDKLASEQALTAAGQREARVAAAVAAWQATSYLPGAGHNTFFKLGAALKRAGLDEVEIRAKLTEQAAYARSPRERRAEITGILKSLRRSGILKGGAR
jgi:hypothetical protein